MLGPPSLAEPQQFGSRQHLTSKFWTSSFTLAAVSVDCLPDEASLISVERKFLHFFTFSIVSVAAAEVVVAPGTAR